MGFVIEKEDIEAIVNAERGAVERVLKFVRFKLADFQARVAMGTVASSFHVVTHRIFIPTSAQIPN